MRNAPGKSLRVLLLLCIPLLAAFGQERGQREKELEDILRFQDHRRSRDPRIAVFLSDPDSLVRERTARALASLQDTVALPWLVDRLSDPDLLVRWESAFAIGQTAGQLAPSSRNRLEHDLIWNRLDEMGPEREVPLPVRSGEGGSAAPAQGDKGGESPSDRLIEEIGKFGSEQALNDLIGRFGNAYPPVRSRAMIISIARFGMRGIVTREGIDYLLQLTKDPDAAPWEAVYALQRGIGDRPEVRAGLHSLLLLSKSADPLVRMNLAALLGRMHDDHPASLGPLLTMAESDADWRVRVNALKALGNFRLQGNDEALGTFRRSFGDANPYIQMTALAAFGASGVRKDSSQPSRDAFSLLEQIAVNREDGWQWQLQAVADTSLARLEGREAFALIDPARASNPLLKSQMLYALGLTGSPAAAPVLLAFTGRDGDPRLSAAALEGLRELGRQNPGIRDRTYHAALDALGSGDVALVGTAASLLRDSLLMSRTSVSPLLTALGSLRLPDGGEAMQEILSTLETLKDPRAVEPLKTLLEQHDRSIVLAAASALKAITGRDFLTAESLEFEPSWVDDDFAYLNSLPDTVVVRVETARGNVTVALYKNDAPFTVMSFLKLAAGRGFFRGKAFHRVVPNFVVQGGDPRGDGWGGPGYAIRSEFSPKHYGTGSVGMASAGKDTEGSQFFVTQSPQPHLDGRYTLFGTVLSGMEVIDRILPGDQILEVALVR